MHAKRRVAGFPSPPRRSAPAVRASERGRSGDEVATRNPRATCGIRVGTPRMMSLRRRACSWAPLPLRSFAMALPSHAGALTTGPRLLSSLSRKLLPGATPGTTMPWRPPSRWRPAPGARRAPDSSREETTSLVVARVSARCPLPLCASVHRLERARIGGGGGSGADHAAEAELGGLEAAGEARDEHELRCADNRLEEHLEARLAARDVAHEVVPERGELRGRHDDG